MKIKWQKLRATLVLSTFMASLLVLPMTAMGQEREEYKALEVQIEALRKEMRAIESNVIRNSELVTTSTNMHIAGYASAGYTNEENQHAFFHVGKFNPIFHYQYKDLVLLESELEFDVDADGNTDIGLEYMTLDLFLNDYMTFIVGKFLSPVGTFRQNLHPDWINKLPTAPTGFGHDEAAPTANVGVQLRGGIPLGELTNTNMAANYSIHVSNGPRAEVEDGEIEAIETKGFSGDINDNKVFGGRLGFLPFPNIEIGFSGETGEVKFASGAADRDYDVLNGDIVIFGKGFTRGLTLRGEWVQTRLGPAPLGETDNDTRHFRAWYAQASYLLPWFPVEGVVRYGEFKRSKYWKREQWAAGLNYLFANNLVAKFAFESDDSDSGMEDVDRWLFQLAYGF